MKSSVLGAKNMSYQDIGEPFFNLTNTLIMIAVIFAITIPAAVLLLRRRSHKKAESLAMQKKIRVVIRQAPKDEERFIEPATTSDGIQQFIMEKAGKDKAGWVFTAPDGSIRIDSKGRPYAEVYRGATQAIVYNYTDKTLEQPRWNKDESKRFITAEALIRRYAKQAQELSSLKTWLMITMIIVIVCVAIAGYNAYQISKIPIGA